MPTAENASNPDAPPAVLSYQPRPVPAQIPWKSMALVPAAILIAGLIHYLLPDREPTLTTRFYLVLLANIFSISLVLSISQAFLMSVRRWFIGSAPLIAAATIALCIWEVITRKLALLPLPFFPGPEGVLQSLVEDWRVLFDSTWHSLALLLGGYATGVFAGLFSGILIGWFKRARYWGMPVLKLVGPIPATALIPLAMVLFPSYILSAVSLIAFAVWFPVTMLTASGISNTRESYLDVARTLGAGRWYLIYRVAIPAAMPSIFIGLFMGLGASFLTLVVAETVGVKSGLGWYVSWASGWAEYGKVYAAIIIMAAFFSTIMTILFKVRDYVLVWQKGVIKW
jgi:NitT/TauT family transport system permease protein